MHSFLIALALAFASVAHADLSRPLTPVACPCVFNNSAPDWSQSPFFLGIYNFEQRDPYNSTLGPLMFDSSSDAQHLDPSPGPTGNTTGTFIRQQCVSLNTSATNWSARCNAPACTIGDRCPINQPFTVGCWARPSDNSPSERYDMSADAFDGGLGSGFNIGYRQTVPSLGNYMFQIDVDGASNEMQVNSASFFAPAIYHHHVGRFFYRSENPDGTMQQLLDGALDANTVTSDPITACDRFNVGGAEFSTTLQGYYDECFYSNTALSDPTICRIATCGIDGCQCQCDWGGDPTQYAHAPRHIIDGGTITCSLPSCNITTPSTIVPTTTSTSSITSTTAEGATTTTSTSSSTSTSTSTSSTSSTSTSITTSTTSTSTSSTSSTILTTTSTSSSSSTSTSSSSSTSTSTSTTTTTIQALDWSDEAALVLYLRAEETTPASSDLVDASPATNNLSSGSCAVATSDTTNFWDGARSVNNPSSDTCSFPCEVGDGCTDATFAFTTGDFTCGFFARPASQSGGDYANVIGTTLSLAPDGWVVDKNLMTGKWNFYTAMSFTGVTVATTSNASNGVDQFVSVRYDATANSMAIYFNGVSEDTDTADSPGNGADGFNLLTEGDATHHALYGSVDHLYCFNEALTDQSRCRVEVCAIDGSLCTCNGSTYVSKPKHAGSGGPINCVLPACDTASPSYLN